MCAAGLDPSVCKHITLGASTCQGYLSKLGGGCYKSSSLLCTEPCPPAAVRKNWLRRWFVLDFSCQYMAYFEDQTVSECVCVCVCVCVCGGGGGVGATLVDKEFRGHQSGWS